MIYLASPYSHRWAVVRWWRWLKVCRAVSRMLASGMHVYSPIAHTHMPAVLGALPKPFEFWERYDESMIGRCDAVHVLCLAGWAESRGVSAEIRLAERLGKPLHYVSEASLVV